MLGKSTLQSAFGHWKGITRASKEGLEMWAPVGESHYLVSTFGNVKNEKTGRVMKKFRDSAGYLQVNMYLVPMKNSIRRVHRLVAAAFLSNPEGKPDVDHSDNCKTNNNVTNLRYATKSENMRNCSLYKKNKSGVAGVFQHEKSKTWHAHIRVDSKKKHIGCFATKEEAVDARIKASNELYGVFNHSAQKVA